MFPRRVTLLACFALAALFGALGAGSVASAAPGQTVDYGNKCVVTITPPHPQPGQHAVVHGTDFPPDTSQPILLDGTTVLGTAKINHAGIFATPITLPSNLSPGPHTISVKCTSTGGVGAVTIVVDPGTPTTTTGGNGGGGAAANGGGNGHGGNGSFANTGTDSESKVVIGFAAIALGVALVMASRRRRRRHVAAT